jgi:hypothetical protein
MKEMIMMVYAGLTALNIIQPGKRTDHVVIVPFFIQMNMGNVQ